VTDKKQAAPTNADTAVPAEEQISAAEMQELKRDMRSAQLIEWAQKNSQQLIAAAVVFAVVLIGVGYWVEHGKAQKSAAAVLYQQGVVLQDETKQKALFQQVADEYGSTGYADLARLQLGRFDDGAPFLRALMDDSSAPDELRWQARLDLAEREINDGNTDAAMTLLNTSVGVEYQQLRHYLMARATSGETRIGHLKDALAEISHDEELKQKIESMLAGMNAAQ